MTQASYDAQLPSYDGSNVAVTSCAFSLYRPDYYLAMANAIPHSAITLHSNTCPSGTPYSFMCIPSLSLLETPERRLYIRHQP